MDASVGMIAKTAGGIGAAGAVSTAATLGVIYANSEGETKSNTYAEKTLLEKIEEKITALGLTGCQTDSGDKSKTCTVNKDKLKGLIFIDETTTGEVTVENGDVKLKVEMTEEDTEIFADKFKFTIKNEAEAEVKIKKGTAVVHTLKKNIGYEFKTKDTNKLEKAWDVGKLAEKVGLKCPVEGTADKKCSNSTTNTKINVKDGTKSITGATATFDKKITFAEGEAGYNQGLKFTVDGTADITLSGGTKKPDNETINLTKDKSYEIKRDGDGWYLIKKD